MATSQAVPATTAAVIGSGSGMASTISQTIVGSHIFKIDCFSATKNLGVGKSIKSSTFRIGRHDWYIKCYPCGVEEKKAGWVSLFLCRQDDHTGSSVSGECEFSLMESLKDGCFEKVMQHGSEMVTFANDDRHWPLRTDFIKRKKAESLLKEEDCFHVRCVVMINKFPAVPQPDLATKTMAGSHSHVLTIDGWSKTRRAHAAGDIIESNFCFAGHGWYIWFYPCPDEDEDEDKISVVSASLCRDQDNPPCNNEVKVRFEITLLTHAGQTISSIQDFCIFSDRNDTYNFEFLPRMEHESTPLLEDGIQIRCDMAVVEGITAMPNPRRGVGGDLQLHGSQQVRVRGDVTFEVAGHLFPAHKCVLTTRCTAFMAEFFGQAGKENADVTDQPVSIDDMEPKVFEALLHFIYTDALPDVREEDKVGMAQGLLVAADRYAMERLKLMCADMLCSYVNDARTAVDTLEMAVKHGYHRLKEACKKFLMDNFAKVAP